MIEILKKILGIKLKFSNDESSLTQHLPLFSYLAPFLTLFLETRLNIHFAFATLIILIIAILIEFLQKKFVKNGVISYFDIWYSVLPSLGITLVLLVLK